MTQIIIPPDVEALAVEAVNLVLPVMVEEEYGIQSNPHSGRASTKVRNPRPPMFGRIMRIGGNAETLVTEYALLTLEGWADDEQRAVWLLNRMRGILRAQDGVLFGYDESPGSVSNLPDPTTGQTRYTTTIGIRARAVVTAT